MITFKSCPRCKGDIVSDSDYYGDYKSCLACGYVGYPGEDSISQIEPDPVEDSYDGPALLEFLGYRKVEHL